VRSTGLANPNGPSFRTLFALVSGWHSEAVHTIPREPTGQLPLLYLPNCKALPSLNPQEGEGQTLCPGRREETFLPGSNFRRCMS
jgi:hypothetical protein